MLYDVLSRQAAYYYTGEQRKRGPRERSGCQTPARTRAFTHKRGHMDARGQGEWNALQMCAPTGSQPLIHKRAHASTRVARGHARVDCGRLYKTDAPDSHKSLCKEDWRVSLRSARREETNQVRSEAESAFDYFRTFPRYGFTGVNVNC